MDDKNIEAARQHFFEMGHLIKCPNKEHLFTVGRFVILWQIARSNSWASVSSKGFLDTMWFSIGTTENIRGIKTFRLCIWKLLLLIARY